MISLVWSLFTGGLFVCSILQWAYKFVWIVCIALSASASFDSSLQRFFIRLLVWHVVPARWERHPVTSAAHGDLWSAKLIIWVASERNDWSGRWGTVKRTVRVGLSMQIFETYFSPLGLYLPRQIVRSRWRCWKIVSDIYCSLSVCISTSRHISGRHSAGGGVRYLRSSLWWLHWLKLRAGSSPRLSLLTPPRRDWVRGGHGILLSWWGRNVKYTSRPADYLVVL